MKKHLLVSFAILVIVNLEFNASAQICRFDSTAQGWSTVGDAYNFTHLIAGGFPNGHIKAKDAGNGLIWYFLAPFNFLGNKLSSYGKYIRFDFKTSNVNLTPGTDLIIEGGGIIIYHSFSSLPSSNWHHYDFLLDTAGGWKKPGNISVSFNEFQTVLSTVTSIKVRGEWYNLPGDNGYLDNFLLEPIVSFASSDTILCEKQSIDFFDNSFNSPISWQWFFPGGVPASSTIQNPVGIYYGSYGSYDVTLITCDSNSECDTLFLHNFIHEVQNPSAPIVVLEGDSLISEPAYSYQWYFNSILIPGATSQVYVFQQPGNYNVIITDINGCASSSSNIFTNINELDHEAGFKIFPIPVSDKLSVSLNFKNYTSAGELIIFNTKGGKIYNSKILNHEVLIDVHAIPAGIYLIQIQFEKNIFCKKFTVLH